MSLYPSNLPNFSNKNLLYLMVLLRFISDDKYLVLAQRCTLATYSSGVTLRSSTSSLICGGILVQARWVLTASHCLDGIRNPTSLGVMGKGLLPETQRVIEVEKVYIQDVYDPKTLEHNICLLYLKKGFSHPMTFPSLSSADLFTYLVDIQETIATILGWVGNRPKNPGKVMDSFCLAVRLGTLDDCAAFYERYVDNETMFCTSSGPEGEQPCKGDTGCPLFVKGVVLGLVTYGKDCKMKDALTLFSRVDRALEFIEQTVRSQGYEFGNKSVEGFYAYYVGSRGFEAKGSLIVALVAGLVLLTVM
ncbi:hypothetical protein Zmor_023075 [Zophobas morio]|uniref:Peptidase S1 domain-containing protein n=1 Tax=Zophobas morio TaxID=2755281 RepID=A0AA38HYZ4_9CUCU|nr:hypothetical protein Zmor_023075 [Zophobas morio]